MLTLIKVALCLIELVKIPALKGVTHLALMMTIPSKHRVKGFVA
ncbi:hypothetical protein AB4562_13240 [Vibrio sp. 10N.222.54.A1]|jgi:hypothetical protein|uniref:Uncharacterized protein n=1 Tax=Vibrio cyclitrophicus TaxID=47951 RepID=A0ACD5FZQ5_9VIBR|nr:MULTISPECIES: hypothetical protein [Vibrio]